MQAKPKYKFKLLTDIQGTGQNPTLFQLFKAQGYRCFYCDKHQDDLDNISKDHLFPRKDGRGTGGDGNTVIACTPCNNKKGQTQPAQKDIYKAYELYKTLGITFIVEERKGKLLTIPLTHNVNPVII